MTEPLFEGKSTVQGNCRIVLPGGTEIPVEFSASPLRSPEGTLFGILYVFRQTTERERIQNLVLRELEELSRIQKRLLPDAEVSLPGLQVRWFFRPSAFGGGDSIGFFRLDETHSAFYAADVVGQGILPALFSLLLHTFLSPDIERGGILIEKRCEEPRRRILTPAEVVRELNRRFFLSEQSNPYFTLVYGIVDTVTGITHLARAGHPYPILQRANGRVEQLKPEGFAVGLFPRSESRRGRVPLRAGRQAVPVFRRPGGGHQRGGGALLVQQAGADRLDAEGQPARRGRGPSWAARSSSWRGEDDFDDDVSLVGLERE